MNSRIPSGTLTFFATDIQGSTELWELNPALMPVVLARHDDILRTVVEAHGGSVFKTTGDGMYAAFASAPTAVAAALAAQRALIAEPWPLPQPLQVRMALHSGEAEARGGDYFGPPVNRVARILSAGHGGQVLLSQTVERLVAERLPVEASLHDLGARSLKDLTLPERLFQLVAPGLPAEFPPLLTLDVRPHNLPAQTTPLVGREEAVRSVRSVLLRPDVRLVTLTGPGGIGKTRLALQVAAEVIDAFKDGVQLVNLASVQDPALLASVVLQTLGLVPDGDQPAERALADHLRRREMLLILDNFEQLVEAAPLVTELLQAAGALKVLVTSQAVLRLGGEHEVPIAPLELPAKGASNPDALRTNEAVALFVQRAQAVVPSFALTEGNAAAIASIARQLDGLPLALELAAARIKLFPPEAMLRRLDRAFEFLKSGERDRPDRHRTLRGAIGWSYDLLSEPDRQVFERTSVFDGGFALQSAEAVAGEPDGSLDVLESLSSLADKSLLRQTRSAGEELRFERLRTIRAFARERLDERGQADLWRRRHAEHFAQIAESLQPGGSALSGGRDVRTALEGLELEYQNVRAALLWALDAGDAHLAVRLSQALPALWFRHGLFREAEGWLGRLLALSDALSDLERAHVLGLSGRLAQIRGDNSPDVITRFEESLRLYRVAGDRRGVARSLMSLGNVRSRAGEYDEARALFEESLALYSALDDPLGISGALMNLGDSHRAEGDAERAIARFQEACEVARRRGNETGLAFALQYLGATRLEQGDMVRAAALLEESREIFQKLSARVWLAWTTYYEAHLARIQGEAGRAWTLFGEALREFASLDYAPGIAEVLLGLAGLAAAENRCERAARLLGAAESLRRNASITRAPLELDLERETVKLCYAAMGGEAFAQMRDEGRTITPEEAVGLALDAPCDPAEPTQRAPAPYAAANR